MSPIAFVPAPAISLVVYGEPKPQGSTTSIGFIRKSGPKAGKVGVRTFNSASTASWRAKVDQAVQETARNRSEGPLDGPLVGAIRFYLTRPKSHPKTRRTWPIGRPDLSKLLRSCEDALIGVLIVDDSRIVRYSELFMDYACYSADPRPRAEFDLWELTGDLLETAPEPAQLRAWG